MTFAVPLFLLAALAGAIPVALHMINRQKVKDLPFPTLQFLRISVEKTRRRKRIEDVILMLIRVAALLLIAFGLARPTITSLGALFSGGANSAVAVIIDNSASMGTIDKDRIRFETATVAAEQILGELEDGDQVVAMLTSGPPRPEQEQLERDQAKAVQLLNQAQLSYERADLGVHLGQARQLLASSTAPNKYIYVLSDMQSSCWESLRQAKEAEIEGKRAAAAKGESKAESGESPAKDASPAPNGLTPEQLKEAQSIPVIVVDVNRVPKPNVAVQRLTLQTTVPVAGVPIKATVELLNTAKVDQQRRAELWVDGTRESVSPELNIPAEGTMVHEFVFSFQRGGMHKGEVRLVGDDGNKLDDRRFFSMDVDQAVPVAVVKAARHEIPYLEDTFYLEHALNPDEADNWAMQTTSLVAGDLMSENLEAYKVIFCVNLPTPNADVAARLQEYVMGGGTLVWIAGDNVEPEQYNRMNEESQNSLLPAPLLDARAPVPGEGRDSWRVTFLDKEHPALRTLVEPAS
ncbi:MAG: vWA domain-containing protein, partial [Planctomycetota bacterium]